MCENVALHCGVITVIAISIYTFIQWIMASLNGLRVEKVALFYSPFFSLFKSSINSIQMNLGWLPFGSYINLAGVYDNDIGSVEIETPKEYEFRSKSLWTKFAIVKTSSISLIILGVLILISNSTIPFIQVLVTYLQISFFALPISAGNEIWLQMTTNSFFLLGIIFLVLGIINISTNLGVLFNTNETITLLFSSISLILAIAFVLVFIRLILQNFEILYIIYFYIGAIVTGIFSFICSVILAKVLPNQ